MFTVHAGRHRLPGPHFDFYAHGGAGMPCHGPGGIKQPFSGANGQGSHMRRAARRTAKRYFSFSA
ncbi:MAG: hypothetical protein DBY17_03420 [Oscillospiraceae bacterium]|nr:MAG: hypothetical protein DBY17_03420 [Oscillospiraceae bacterium]